MKFWGRNTKTDLPITREIIGLLVGQSSNATPGDSEDELPGEPTVHHDLRHGLTGPGRDNKLPEYGSQTPRDTVTSHYTNSARTRRTPHTSPGELHVLIVSKDTGLVKTIVSQKDAAGLLP